eukprot:m.480300 g.480300  ORF g.480300 m.480300 type:complete len:114 (+) comp21771_c0_seq1:185-526(+)
MALFVSAKREMQTIYLEPSATDKAGKLVEVIADIVGKDADEVALVFQGKRLDDHKTLAEQNVSTGGEGVVEPIPMFFVFKKEGTDDFEEPHAVAVSEPTTAAPDAAAPPPEST